MKLRHKVSALAFIVGSIVLFSTIYMHEYVSHEASIKEAEHHLETMSKEVAFHLNVFLEEKIAKTQTLATTPILINALSMDNARFSRMSDSARAAKIKTLNQQWMSIKDKTDPFIQIYLNNPVAAFLEKQKIILPGEYGEIFLTNRYGAIIASTEKLSTLAHAHKQWWAEAYSNGIGKVFIDDRGYDESVAGYVLGIVVPVYDDNGKIVGILKCNYNIKGNFDQFISNFTLTSEEGFLRIVRTKGLVVFAPGKKPLSNSVADTVREHLSTVDSGSLVTVGNDGVEHIIGHSIIKITRGTNKIGFGGTWKTLDQSQGNIGESWHAVTCIPKQRVLLNLHKTDNFQIIAGFVTVLLLAIICYVFGGIIARPVAKFSEAAAQVSHGDYDVEIDIKDDSEIGRAAKAFNGMVDELKRARDDRDRLMQNRMRSAQLEVLGTVAAGVAHEINNPIQGILNYATLIRQKADDNDKITDYATRIINESDRVAKVTQNLLTYSRENHSCKELADPNELIKSAISLIEQKLINAGIVVEYDCQEDMQKIKLYPQLFQQVILNLAHNAYDALRNKEFADDVPRITIACSLNNDIFQVEVRDNGEGIDSCLLDKVVRPFFTTKPSSEGTGLGLSIVEEIIRKHGGSMKLESTRGQSTTVYASIPA